MYLTFFSDVINVKVVFYFDLGHILGLGDVPQFAIIFLVFLSSCISLFLSLLLLLSLGCGGNGSLHLLFLGALLLLDQQTLRLLLICLAGVLSRLSFSLLFVSVVLFTSGPIFVAVPVCFLVVLLGQPADKVGEEGAHCVLSLAIVQLALPIKLDLFGVPLREQFTVQHTVIVECLAEGGRKFLLLRVAVNEEKDDGLE